ncbi:MAG TPA: patatin-like phospholipase family protein [Gemmataceae bacterium]|nr:patatin-like phospholipase family protein [Gemmataceae bacterium]
MTSINPSHDPTIPPPTPAGAAALKPSLQSGVACCLSGGGYRAMLFHVGSLWRFNEAGLLPQLKCFSAVSGGSITAGVLASNWAALNFDSNRVAGAFVDAVVNPIRTLARHTIDIGSVVGGLLNPFGTIAESIAAAYRKHLFGNKTLQDLPDSPVFVFNATNVQTSALWRFTKAFMGDYRTGLVEKPAVELAVAVGASSAFPPFLSPVHLDVSGQQFKPDSIADLQYPPYTTKVVLSDGGVYDNLGLEPVFKHFDTVLVSDGGLKIAPEGEPASDWGRHAYRVLDLIDNQVRSLRKRLLIDAYRDHSRKGAYWGIRTDILNYHLADAMNEQCPPDRTLQLATVPTRLEAMPEDLQERLINWGYAVCDAALRKHYDETFARPQGFPYPARGV